MDWIKYAMGFIGHLGLWCVIFNRIHATAWPRSKRKTSEKAIIMMVAIPFVWVACLVILRRDLSFNSVTNHPITFYYFYICILSAIFFVSRWVVRKATMGRPDCVSESKTEWVKLHSDSGTKNPFARGSLATWMSRIPFNEAFKLTLQRMTFRMDVPAALDGLKICQLSDLHFTGQIDIEYFHRVIEYANDFEPDLIVVTGDLIDAHKCLDWIDDTLGRLRAKLGVYYVLGNHDRRIKDEADLRQRLAKAGLIQASGQWLETEFNGATLQITGNELPWYSDVARLPSELPPKPAMRILLSHSPDQLDWARNKGFELMFAGHTHGGQIALPFVGALVAPSKYGVLYAAGTFKIGEMLMHVSRGISGDETVRICSPPELGLFTIRSKSVNHD